eukprot:CAMPEP_0194255624 /NCGR_PEP_ID=MMETSP0158-20130606/34847_1 /TAXON_ID=33649 /ORGANISM="Thalassionema nitzschioides, Strain L26-B" /LENGTH=924 /DNA_ID=CAMNT_0038994037 /DNA_START=142 /DNA_END=2913 /DNA_ORIENTATION=+
MEMTHEKPQLVDGKPQNAAPDFDSDGVPVHTEGSIHRQQIHMDSFSSEEESMAAVEDDYDDESCSSSEDIPHERLDRMEFDQRDLDAKGMPTVSNSTMDPSDFHEPRALPRFQNAKMCMWTSSHAANSPSEDRSCSLVNILLRPLLSDKETKNRNNRILIRVSLWSVIDGHGGGCVATYASEVLLPHVAASIARALKCEIVDRGVCTVNGELRDANALDLDGLIRTSDRSRSNPKSINYRSPNEFAVINGNIMQDNPLAVSEEDTVDNDPITIPPSMQHASSIASPVLRQVDEAHSISSAKTSVKTGSSHQHAPPVGTHSPGEVTKIKEAITESFLAVDEGWINSIDPIATHQSTCQSNGRWNAGACALVVFTVQRLEWKCTSTKERTAGTGGQGPRDDTSQNKDAARRRMLDYAAKAKCVSSTSTISSTSSMLTEDDPNMLSAFESEITETEDDGEESVLAAHSRKSIARKKPAPTALPEQTVITTPGGCDCHFYRPNEAMLYTAHVGDCRAVLFGSAPPRTIKVVPVDGSTTDHPDTTDDESSHHSSDETECLSSSDHDAESSDEDDMAFERRRLATNTPPYLNYLRRPTRRPRRSRRDMGNHAPFVALPPLPISPHSSSEESESEDETLAPPEKRERASNGDDSDENSNESSLLSPHGRDTSPPIVMPPFTRPIDLTTDHSAYNPAEVNAVLRRCNNAPRAISAGMGGGIKRVAGSLAVTRALGDAYLKTPLLSFDPYKSHAPYITSRPEVNCRRLDKDGDRVIILATDGVWERCGGADVLRWVRNYSSERIAEAERRKNRRRVKIDRSSLKEDDKQEMHSQIEEEKELQAGQKRDRHSPAASSKKRSKMPRRRERGGPNSCPGGPSAVSTVADVIVRRVLNKVRRARNMTSLYALMSLPKGRARRSKHDDITASVVDLSA